MMATRKLTVIILELIESTLGNFPWSSVVNSCAKIRKKDAETFKVNREMSRSINMQLYEQDFNVLGLY